MDLCNLLIISGLYILDVPEFILNYSTGYYTPLFTLVLYSRQDSSVQIKNAISRLDDETPPNTSWNRFNFGSRCVCCYTMGYNLRPTTTTIEEYYRSNYQEGLASPRGLFHTSKTMARD